MAGMYQMYPSTGKAQTDKVIDEPRRSGRATKGVNTKERDIDEATTTAPRKGKGKGNKSKAAEEDEGEDEVTRCVCGEGADEEDVPRAMICCDKCEVWQHNDCMGLAEDYQPDSYFCEQCRPADHKSLLAAMKRGEKPWEEAARRRQVAEAERAAKKKGGKRGKKSLDARDSPATPGSGGQKRKAEDSPAPSETKVNSSPLISSDREAHLLQSSKRARGTPAETNGKPGARKSSSQTPSRGPPVAQDVKELPQQRQSGAVSLTKMFIDQTKSAVKAGSLSRDTASDVHGTQTGLLVEHALYHVHSAGSAVPTQAYKEQLRAIVFNLKRNANLALDILKQETSPYELAAMDPKQMASEEQQAKDAAMVKEMERQHSIMEQQEQGPRIRRTHKGEEYVDEDRAAPSQPSAPPKRAAANQDTKSPEIKSPTHPSRRQPSVTIPRRQSSANFDINKVYSSVHTQDGEQRFGELPQAPSGGPVHEPAGPGARADADIDALLKDEDADSEPYSPKEYTDDGTVWRGAINGGTLGRFTTSARYAAGAKPDDQTLRTTWAALLPEEIGINGRIQPAKADEYLCGLEFSSSSDMLVIWMSEPSHEPDLSGFNKFFNYFKAKERFGVGAQNHQPALKDIYFVPMNKGQEMPAFVKKLEGDFSTTADEKGLLVPLVIKNTELPHGGGGVVASPSVNTLVQSPSVGPPVQMQTPITPQFTNSPYAPPNGVPHQQMQMDGAQPYSQTPYQQPQPQGAVPNFPTTHTVGNAQPNQALAPAAIAAQRILGPQLASTPAVIALVQSAPNAGELEMSVVKECIAENPAASESLEVLTRMLQERWGRDQAEQRNQQVPGAGQPGGPLPGLGGETGA